MINKIVRKSLLKSKKLIIVIFLLFIVAQMLFVTDKTTYPVLTKEIEAFYEKTNVEDFRIFTIKEVMDKYDDSWQDDIEKKYDLTLEQKEYFNLQVYDKDSDSNKSYGILKYDSDDNINKIDLADGTYPSKKGEVLLDPEYLVSKNLNIGDTINLDGSDFKIVGTGYIVDYVFPVDLFSGDMSIGNDKFVPLYMNPEDFKTISKDKEEVYFSGKFNKEPENKTEIYKSIMNDYTYQIPLLDANANPQKDSSGAIITKSVRLIPLVLDVDNNPAITSIKREIRGEQTLFNILSSTIFLITVVVIIILFNNIFTSQKKEIGILRAAGVYEKELGFNYVLYLISTLLVAAIIGTFLGIRIKMLLTGFLTSIFNFPVNTVSQSLITLSIFLIIFIITIVVIIVYFIAIKRNLQKDPILLLKNIETEKPPKIKLDRFTKNMKFINKYKFNILFRNIAISLLLIFGVFISSFLLLMGGSIKTSFDKALSNDQNGQVSYEYSVIYSKGKKDPVYDENSLIVSQANVEGITSNTYVKQVNSSIRLVAYDFFDNDYINLLDENQEPLDDHTVYMTTLTANLYDLEIGDSISLINPYDSTNTINLRIGGIVDSGSVNQLFIDIHVLQRMLDLDLDYANAEVGVKDQETEIYKYDPNANYERLDDGDENETAMIAMINFTIFLIALVAIFISTITLTIITLIIISKNKKTISIMKVMGYTDKEINQMVISPYKWILIVVYFASIPLFEYMIQQLVNLALKDIDIVINIKIPFSSSIIGFICIFIIYFISLLVSKRGVQKISLAESLKSDD